MEPEDEGEDMPGPRTLPPLYDSPAGCGAAGALVFALLTGPSLLLGMGYGAGCLGDAGCAPVPWGMLALAAAVAAGYGYAVWDLVSARAEALAQGGSNRPPLWVALVGLTLVGMMAALTLVPLLVFALAG